MVSATAKMVKEIKVDLDKCIGCRACEMVCSAFHATPRYSSVNPARSRIRVVRDVLKDVYVPVRASDYTPAECAGRHAYTVEGKEYPECSFCGVCCPARDLFKEPDSGLPLRCDMCEELPSWSGPLCVQVCRPGALSYQERAAQLDQETPPTELEVALKALINGQGLQNVRNTVARMSQKSEETRGG